MSSTKRLFIAIPLSEDILAYVQKVQQDFRALNCFTGSFPLPVHQHITLSFLGDIDEKEVQNIKQVLASIRFDIMQLRLSTIDCFSSSGKIRVIFIHIICPELVLLAQEVQNSVSEWVKSEKRPFVPHITLARIKTVSDRHELLNYINRYEVEKMVFACDELVLFESVRVESALEHKVIQKYGL